MAAEGGEAGKRGSGAGNELIVSTTTSPLPRVPADPLIREYLLHLEKEVQHSPHTVSAYARDLAAFEETEEACLVEAGLVLFGSAEAAGYETTIALALWEPG